MSRSWSERLTRRPQDQAAQAAQDGAVAAFLDLDNRQSYVKDAIDAVGENSVDPALMREWTSLAQLGFDATSRYLATAESNSLLNSADRPTGVDPVAAASAFGRVHQLLAEAAVAVDVFYRKHADELEKARSLRSATPQIAADARAAAVMAEAELTKAETEGFAYPSVMTAAGELVDALSGLTTAETVGTPLQIRHTAAAVHAAANAVGTKIVAARTLSLTVRGSLSSVRTRIDAMTTRLDSLPATRSALLREFSVDCSKDLNGADDRARKSLQDAGGDWSAAQTSLHAGQPEPASQRLATARSKLSAAENDGDSLAERLRILRATKTDPAAAAKNTRFKLRDAQLLVVDRGLVAQWGSVLDAQSARIERAAADLTGTHPDYWSYLQTLNSVEAFLRGVIDRVRGQAR